MYVVSDDMQLKCSDEQKDQSCMNCIIYGTPCLYTSPQTGGGKRKESTSRPARPRKSQGNAERRSSTSPSVLKSQRSPSIGDESARRGRGKALRARLTFGIIY